MEPDDVIDFTEDNFDDDDTPEPDFQLESRKTDKKKLPLWKKLLGITGALLLIFGILVNIKKIRLPMEPDNLWINFSLLAFPALLMMISLGSFGHKSEVAKREKRKLGKRTVVSAIIVLLFIPITIYIGNAYLYDQKYLFISLLVLFECMVPFFLVFEGRKPQARELVIIAVLCAIAIAGRTLFIALPQVKPVLAIVIISGAAFGGETGFMVGAVTMLVSNFYFGQGAWTPWQMFAAGIIGFLAGVLFKKGLLYQSRGVLCVFGFIVTVVIYGGIMNFSTLILTRTPVNFQTVTAYMLQGLPLDIIHGFSTLAVLFFLAEPMLEKLERVKTKYGLL